MQVKEESNKGKQRMGKGDRRSQDMRVRNWQKETDRKVRCNKMDEKDSQKGTN
jgi:hypothetical protein